MINFIIQIDKDRKYYSIAFIWYQNCVAGVVICVKILSGNLFRNNPKKTLFLDQRACRVWWAVVQAGQSCTLPLDLQTYIFLQAYSL